MCIYDRSDFACGHQQWGPMKAQCTRYWRKCCIRSCHESFTFRAAGQCKHCQVAALKSLAASRPVAIERETIDSTDLGIAPSSTLKLTLRLNPFPATDSRTLSGREKHSMPQAMSPANMVDLVANMDDCVRRYENEHNLPKESISLDVSRNVAFNGAMQHSPATRSGTAWQDDYIHMKLREQQNKIRISRKRGPEEYEAQLQMLVMQNKKRLMMAGHEQSPGDRSGLEAPEDEQIREMEAAMNLQEKVTDSILIPGIENNRVEVHHDVDAWSPDELDEWSHCGDELLSVDKI